MTTGTLTFNEKSDFGKHLLQLIQTDAETTFEVRRKAGKAHAADERKKKRIMNEIRQSIRHANENEGENAKTYTFEELIESL